MPDARKPTASGPAVTQGGASNYCGLRQTVISLGIRQTAQISELRAGPLLAFVLFPSANLGRKCIPHPSLGWEGSKDKGEQLLRWF